MTSRSGLDAIARVRTERHDVKSGMSSTEEPVFILSDPAAGAGGFLRTIRHPWGIEHKLHWVLEMTFGEDGNRTRVGNAAANFAVSRHGELQEQRARSPWGRAAGAARVCSTCCAPSRTSGA